MTEPLGSPSALLLAFIGAVVLAFILGSIGKIRRFKNTKINVLEEIKLGAIGQEFTHIEFTEFMNKKLRDKASFKDLRKRYIEKLIDCGILKERRYFGLFNERTGICIYTVN